MPQGHYWEQCRERRERESEDEPAPKKGEQPPVPLNQLVAVRTLREKFPNFIGKGRTAPLVGFVESPCVYLCGEDGLEKRKALPARRGQSWR